jgi:hypothetical protein
MGDKSPKQKNKQQHQKEAEKNRRIERKQPITTPAPTEPAPMKDIKR